MDVNRLELLRELSERRSITEVARALHRTPSAVSQQLKVLEREAGLPLTERSGRGLTLTDAGRALAKSATDVAVAIERANALWDEFRNKATGEVSILTFPTAGQMLLPGTIRGLAELGDIVLRCTDRDPELSDFSELAGEHDIVLAHTMTGQHSWSGRELRVVPLMTEQLDIGLAADHRLASRSYVTPADVVNDPWIGVPSGFPFERVLNEIETQGGGRLNVVQRFSDLRIIEAFITAGLGVALFPRYSSGVELLGKMVLKPLRGVQAQRQIVALMRPDRAERLAVRTVVAVLRQQAAEVQRLHAMETGAITLPPSRVE
jgi:DNA-binding transcriptional LysR family regulator